MTVETETRVTLPAFGVMSRLSAAKCRQTEVEYKSGARYSGDVVGTQRSGRGVFTWTDGAHYEGEFANNMRHGTGDQSGLLERHDMFLIIF
jgi:hypothetical protein